LLFSIAKLVYQRVYHEVEWAKKKEITSQLIGDSNLLHQAWKIGILFWGFTKNPIWIYIMGMQWYNPIPRSFLKNHGE